MLRIFLSAVKLFRPIDGLGQIAGLWAIYGLQVNKYDCPLYIYFPPWNLSSTIPIKKISN
jgi:hypothetical protein